MTTNLETPSQYQSDFNLALPEGSGLPWMECRSDSMEYVHNDVLILDLDNEGLYPPKDIVVQNPKFTMKVVSEVCLPNYVGDDGDYFAIVQVTRKSDGLTGYGLKGLVVDPRTNKVKGSEKQMIALPANGDQLVLTDDPDAAKGSASVYSGDIWGDDELRRRGKNRGIVELFVDTDSRQLVINDRTSRGIKAVGKVVEQEPVDKYVAEHTISVNSLARRHGLIDEEGRFADRYRIDRDTEIGGDSIHTIDIRSWGSKADNDLWGEAIVVDGKGEYADIYKDYFDKTIKGAYANAAESGRGKISEQDFLEAIGKTVEEKMSYDLEYTEQLLTQLDQSATASRKVNLGEYLEARKGVCRHMALITAWLGGELKQRGFLSGKLTAEVNAHADIGAHEWGRYTAEDGKVTIIDPANHYIGGVVSDKWDYRRDEEKKLPMLL